MLICAMRMQVQALPFHSLFRPQLLDIYFLAPLRMVTFARRLRARLAKLSLPKF